MATSYSPAIREDMATSDSPVWPPQIRQRIASTFFTGNAYVPTTSNTKDAITSSLSIDIPIGRSLNGHTMAQKASSPLYAIFSLPTAFLTNVQLMVERNSPHPPPQNFSKIGVSITDFPPLRFPIPTQEPKLE